MGKKLLCILLCILLTGCTRISDEETSLYTYFFSVGKADAILLYTYDSAVLIDTGYEESAEKILAYMNQIGIQKLDALIITHFDKDHVGGAAEILKSVKTEAVYISSFPKDSEEYNAFAAQLEKEKLSAQTVFGEEPTVLELDGVVYTIDGPDKETYGNNDSNNSSLIVDVSYGSVSYLLTGDAQNERVEEYLEDYYKSFDLLKLPHHGVWQKSLKELVFMCDPTYAVICSDNTADSKTIEYLEDYPTEVLITQDGDIQITTDGKEIVVTKR